MSEQEKSRKQQFLDLLDKFRTIDPKTENDKHRQSKFNLWLKCRNRLFTISHLPFDKKKNGKNVHKYQIIIDILNNNYDIDLPSANAIRIIKGKVVVDKTKLIKFSSVEPELVKFVDLINTSLIAKSANSLSNTDYYQLFKYFEQYAFCNAAVIESILPPRFNLYQDVDHYAEAASMQLGLLENYEDKETQQSIIERQTEYYKKLDNFIVRLQYYLFLKEKFDKDQAHNKNQKPEQRKHYLIPNSKTTFKLNQTAKQITINFNAKEECKLSLVVSDHSHDKESKQIKLLFQVLHLLYGSGPDKNYDECGKLCNVLSCTNLVISGFAQ